MRNGVPFDVAFQLDELTVAAWCIIFSEQDGATFDWDTMAYRKPA